MPANRSSCARRAFDAFARLQKAKTRHDAEQTLIAELAYFGFEYVTCADMPAPGQDPLKSVLLNTRPLAYVMHYVERGYTTKDPVVTELEYTRHTFSWSDVRARRSLSVQEQRIIDEAQEFRVRDGLIIPIVTTSGQYSIVCPCGEMPELSEEPRAAVELIAIAAFQCMKRLSAEKKRQDLAPLTLREREVLQWILSGKTNEDIATILSISPRTVQSHIVNARAKLDATNSVQAVGEALRRGELSL